MSERKGLDALFDGRHFDREIIIVCVRWYLRYKLSRRDLVEIMAERGLSLVHTTIMRWVKRFTPEFVKRWNLYRYRGFGRNSHQPAARYRVPVIVIVVNNGIYETICMHRRENTPAVNLRPS